MGRTQVFAPSSGARKRADGSVTTAVVLVELIWTPYSMGRPAQAPNRTVRESFARPGAPSVPRAQDCSYELWVDADDGEDEATCIAHVAPPLGYQTRRDVRRGDCLVIPSEAQALGGFLVGTWTPSWYLLGGVWIACPGLSWLRSGMGPWMQTTEVGSSGSSSPSSGRLRCCVRGFGSSLGAGSRGRSWVSWFARQATRCRTLLPVN